eukprot:COSAG01_NODE_18178_length_1094_cov_1.177711_1_plen_29_part_10
MRRFWAAREADSTPRAEDYTTWSELPVIS